MRTGLRSAAGRSGAAHGCRKQPRAVTGSRGCVHSRTGAPAAPTVLGPQPSPLMLAWDFCESPKVRRLRRRGAIRCAGHLFAALVSSLAGCQVVPVLLLWCVAAQFLQWLKAGESAQGELSAVSICRFCRVQSTYTLSTHCHNSITQVTCTCSVISTFFLVLEAATWQPSTLMGMNKLLTAYT